MSQLQFPSEKSVQVRAEAAMLLRELAECVLTGENPLNTFPFSQIFSTLSQLTYLDAVTRSSPEFPLDEANKIRTKAAKLFRELADKILVGKLPLKTLPVKQLGSMLALLAFIDPKTSYLELFTELEAGFMETAKALESDTQKH